MMISKKNIIVVGAVTVTLIVVIIILSFSKNKTNNTVQITPTAKPTYYYEKSESGALLISQTPEEMKIVDEIGNLRDKSPVDTGKFIITYDWKLVAFTVKPKDKATKQSELQDWLRQYGYDLIPAEDFKFIQ